MSKALDLDGDRARRTRNRHAVQEVSVLDFGGQYSQLIARRIRECGVFSELLPHDLPLEEILRRQPRGLVLSGGPASVYDERAPQLRAELLELGLPALGICYGMQAMARELGGRVERAEIGEFGRTELRVTQSGRLLDGLPDEQSCWMSHRDTVFEPPPGFTALASSPASPVAAFESPGQEPLRNPVPSRGRAHAARHADPREVPATRSAAARAPGARPRSSTSRSSCVRDAGRRRDA